MKCRYCGNKLGLGRRLASSQFCSREHELSFQQEYRATLLTRLNVVVGREAEAGGLPRPAAPPPVEFLRTRAWGLVPVQGAASFAAEPRLPELRLGPPALPAAAPRRLPVAGWFDSVPGELEPRHPEAIAPQAAPLAFRPAMELGRRAEIAGDRLSLCTCPAESRVAGSTVAAARSNHVEPLAPARPVLATARPLTSLLRASAAHAFRLAAAGPAATASCALPDKPGAARAEGGGVWTPRLPLARPEVRLGIVPFPMATAVFSGLPAAGFAEAGPRAVQPAARTEPGESVSFAFRTAELPAMRWPKVILRLPQAGHAALRLETMRQRPLREPAGFGPAPFRVPEPRLDCAPGLCSPPLSSLMPPAAPAVRTPRRKPPAQPKPVAAGPLVPIERPRRLARVVLAVPLAAALVYFWARPDAGRIVQAQWNDTRQAIHSRAFFEMEENFSRDLAAWRQGSNQAKWLFDKSTLARPADLALYAPSRYLTDYRLDFSATIERRGIGWVFRAADVQNYYAMKIVLLSTRPPYPAALRRYAVIEGEQDDEVQSPATLYIAPNTPFPVRVDIKGNQFIASIHGREVDSWSDGRLKSGGVGFFTEKWARNRLLWMRVSNQDDFLGKLCAVIAPHLPQTLNWRTIP